MQEEIALPPLALAVSWLPDRASRVLRRSVSCHACLAVALVLVWLAEACLALPSCAAQRELRSSVEQIAKFFRISSGVSVASARERARCDLVTKDLVQKQAAYLLVALRQRILSLPQTYARRLLGITDQKEMAAKLKEMSRSRY